MNYNHVAIVGRLLKTPVLRQTVNGKSYCFVDVVNETGYGDHKDVNMITAQFFGPQAEFICKYLSTGYRVCVSGEVRTKEVQDGEHKRYELRIVGSSIDNLTSVNDGKALREKHANDTTAKPTSNTKTKPDFKSKSSVTQKEIADSVNDLDPLDYDLDSF